MELRVIIIGFLIFFGTDIFSQNPVDSCNIVSFPNSKNIPGRIQAECWNAKSSYQYQVPTSDVNGVYEMVGISNGSSLDYDVTVLTTGFYTVGFRVATPNIHAQFQIKLGNTVLGSASFPGTGDWNLWATVSITNVSLTAGSQTLRILSTNNDNCNFNWMEFSLPGGTNQPPTANAGVNQTIVTNQVVTLSGSGTSGNGSTLSYAWTQTGGTTATITNPSSASTTITGLTTTGVRTFLLTVTQSDNQTATSNITVTVNNPGPPTANAGPNQTIVTNQVVTLSGSGTSGNGSTLSYAWTQTGGTTATITNPSSASPTITGLTTTGVRTFLLTVTQSDNQTATSNVTITVNPATDAITWALTGSDMYSVPTGNVGIGTSTPSAKLEVSGQVKITGGSPGNGKVLTSDPNGLASWQAPASGGNNSQWTTSSSNIYYNTGNVFIGTIPITDTGYKLFVEKGIRTRKIKVDQSTWPDYVFSRKYPLLSLQELERFIQKNKHLPEVPAATDIEKNGLDLGDNQAILLQKIEELTLYLIELNKKVEKLSAENEALQKKITTKEKP